MFSSSDKNRRDVRHVTQPLVSVVIPAFNASRYIERTLRSAGRQTYQNLEIIVVNDGSTDDTAKVVEQLAREDSRIRLLSTANRGVAAARNTGIQTSSGQFLAFLDADDLWHQTKIEKQVNALNRLSPQWAAVYVLHYIINHDDEIIRSCRPVIARGYIYARHLTFKYVGKEARSLSVGMSRSRLVGLTAHMQQQESAAAKTSISNSAWPRAIMSKSSLNAWWDTGSILATCRPITCRWAEALWKLSGARWPQMLRFQNTQPKAQSTLPRNVHFGNSAKPGTHICHL